MPKKPASSLECPWYSLADMVALFSVGERCIWQWSASGRLPKPVRMGRRWTRWYKPTVDALLRKWGGQPPAEDAEVLPIGRVAS